MGAGADPEGVVKNFAEMVSSGRTAAVSKLKEAFNLTTDITKAERQQVQKCSNISTI